MVTTEEKLHNAIHDVDAYTCNVILNEHVYANSPHILFKLIVSCFESDMLAQEIMDFTWNPNAIDLNRRIRGKTFIEKAISTIMYFRDRVDCMRRLKIITRYLFDCKCSLPKANTYCR